MRTMASGKDDKRTEQNPFSENIKKQFLSRYKKTNFKKLKIINPATEELIKEIADDNANIDS